MQVHFCDRCTRRVVEAEIERGEGYYDGRVCYCRRCMKLAGKSAADAIDAIRGPLADPHSVTGFHREVGETTGPRRPVSTHRHRPVAPRERERAGGRRHGSTRLGAQPVRGATARRPPVDSVQRQGGVGLAMAFGLGALLSAGLVWYALAIGSDYSGGGTEILITEPPPIPPRHAVSHKSGGERDGTFTADGGTGKTGSTATSLSEGPVGRPDLAGAKPDSSLVTFLNRGRYRLEIMDIGRNLFVDDLKTRVGEIPGPYRGLTFIRTARGDNRQMGRRFLSFELTRPARVMVAFDASIRPRPGWLAQFKDTGDVLVDTGSSRRTSYQLYAKVCPVGRVVMGGNSAFMDKAGMYVVLLNPDSAEVEALNSTQVEESTETGTGAAQAGQRVYRETFESGLPEGWKLGRLEAKLTAPGSVGAVRAVPFGPDLVAASNEIAGLSVYRRRSEGYINFSYYVQAVRNFQIELRVIRQGRDRGGYRCPITVNRAKSWVREAVSLRSFRGLAYGDSLLKGDLIVQYRAIVPNTAPPFALILDDVVIYDGPHGETITSTGQLAHRADGKPPRERPRPEPQAEKPPTEKPKTAAQPARPAREIYRYRLAVAGDNVPFEWSQVRVRKIPSAQGERAALELVPDPFGGERKDLVGTFRPGGKPIRIGPASAVHVMYFAREITALRIEAIVDEDRKHVHAVASPARDAWSTLKLRFSQFDASGSAPVEGAALRSLSLSATPSGPGALVLIAYFDILDTAPEP